MKDAVVHRFSFSWWTSTNSTVQAAHFAVASRARASADISDITNKIAVLNMLVTFEKVENWEMYCLNSCTNSFFHTLFLTAPMEQWMNCKNPARLITNYVPDFDERDSTKHANILLAWTWLRFFAKIAFCHRVLVQSWPLCLIQSWTMLMGKTVALCLFLTKGDRESVGYALDQYVSHLFKRCRWEKKTQKKSQTMYQTVQRIK